MSQKLTFIDPQGRRGFLSFILPLSHQGDGMKIAEKYIE